MITFVTHYQKLKQYEKDKITLLCREFSESDPDVYIRCLFESCRQSNPGCRFILLTDPESSFDLPTEIEVLRMRLDRFKLRYAETFGQMQFMLDFKEKSNLVLIDFDMLVQKPLYNIFKKGVDLFLTVRKYPPWIPINMGVCFINEGSAEAAAQLFNLILTKMLSMPEDKLIWGGSQLAVWGILQKEYFALSPIRKILQVSDIRIGLLPADIYNFSTDDSEMSGYYPDKYLLHFKGGRKNYMPPYFEKYIKAKEK